MEFCWENVLVVGAHPDDFEIMAGGVLARAKREGSKTYAIVCTDGALGGEPEMRRSETEAAARVLEIDELVFLDFPDGGMVRDHRTIYRMEEVIREMQPDIIITHSMSDTHQDHVHTCEAVLSAGRRHSRVLLGETPSSRTPLTPGPVFDISDYFETKIEALACHASQLLESGGPLDLEVFRTVAGYHGLQIHTRFAEAFEIWRFGI